MLCGSYHTHSVTMIGKDQKSCRAGNLPLSQARERPPGRPGRRLFRRSGRRCGGPKPAV